mmetsp:Transcript_75128/g.213684  ORF Transcript_75128/g.213684 Transcript_75128/m.213684 type:complete len:235 (-) Transcript_75128:460-1164(-)
MAEAVAVKAAKVAPNDISQIMMAINSFAAEPPAQALDGVVVASAAVVPSQFSFDHIASFGSFGGVAPVTAVAAPLDGAEAGAEENVAAPLASVLRKKKMNNEIDGATARLFRTDVKQRAKLGTAGPERRGRAGAKLRSGLHPYRGGHQPTPSAKHAFVPAPASFAVPGPPTAAPSSASSSASASSTSSASSASFTAARTEAAVASSASALPVAATAPRPGLGQELYRGDAFCAR